MSKVWGFMIIFSIVFSFINGSVSSFLNIVMDSCKASVDNILVLAGMMCFWNGMFNILENTSILEKISYKLKKILALLFDKKELNDNIVNYVSLNMASNIIGVGNASTINGIKAIKCMQEENPIKEIPSNNMTLFILLNTASIQLIPTNMIALRSMYNSANPTEILIPVWIVTIFSLIAGISMIKFLNKRM